MTLRTIFAPIPSTWPALVPLVQSGRFALAETFTHHLGLSQAAEAYELFDSRSDGVLKVLSDPKTELPRGRRACGSARRGHSAAPDSGRAMNQGAGGGTTSRVSASTIGS